MNKLLRFRLTLLSLLGFVIAFAQPAGYYDALHGKRKEDLKTQAYRIVRPHTRLTYNSLWKHFQNTDAYPGTNQVWDMYSDITRYYTSTSGLNREHSFPKSWWGGYEDYEAYTDLNHLYPSDGDANMAKSNYPLGEVTGTVYFDNGVSKIGAASVSGGSSRVFEPSDRYKGDFARTYFYMVTCYQDYSWRASYAWMLMDGSYPTLKPWAIDLLLKWHREDPVDAKERNRNDQVYKIQNNRNPFIDYPDLVEHIWGSKTADYFYLPEIGEPGTPELVQPTNGSTLEFGETTPGESVSLDLYMKGHNLTGNLTITLWSEDAAMFSVAATSVPASPVNAESGYWLNVKYTPTGLGSHRSKFVISDGGIDGSIAVILTGECLPVPSFTTPVALPATDVTKTSYQANWEAMGDVDGYEVTRNIQYADGSIATTVVHTNDNFEIFDDFENVDDGVHSYSVRAYRLGYYSPVSNTVLVNPATDISVTNEGVLRVFSLEGGIRITSDMPIGDIRIFSVTGQLVYQQANVGEYFEASLPKGIYVVSRYDSDNCQKAVVR